jgi:hypothetical protein
MVLMSCSSWQGEGRMGMKEAGPELCADHISVMKFAHDPSSSQFMLALC